MGFCFSRDAIMKPNQIPTTLTLVVLSLWLIVELGGCSWFRRPDASNADQLALNGMEAFEEEDYYNALKAFTKLKERYPYSRYAMLAELKIGDAHFHRKEYPEAIAAYEEFATLHPKNEAIPYVLYQIGACYYAQLKIGTRHRPMKPLALSKGSLNRTPTHPRQTGRGKKYRSAASSWRRMRCMWPDFITNPNITRRL